METKYLVALILILNLTIGCHGGFFGAGAGLFICNGACHLGYAACIGGGTAGTAATATLPALPAVVAACIAGEAACLTACVATFTVVSGPF